MLLLSTVWFVVLTGHSKDSSPLISCLGELHVKTGLHFSRNYPPPQCIHRALGNMGSHENKIQTFLFWAGGLRGGPFDF